MLPPPKFLQSHEQGAQAEPLSPQQEQRRPISPQLSDEAATANASIVGSGGGGGGGGGARSHSGGIHRGPGAGRADGTPLPPPSSLLLSSQPPRQRQEDLGGGGGGGSGVDGSGSGGSSIGGPLQGILPVAPGPPGGEAADFGVYGEDLLG